MDKESLVKGLANLQMLMATFFLNVEQYIKEQEENKAKGLEYDKKMVDNSTPVKMHLGHSMGEFVESKCFICDLTPVDLLTKAQYEKEMSEALSIYSKSKDFTDILNNGGE